MFNKVVNSTHPLFLSIVLYNYLLVVVQSSNECEICIENVQLAKLIEKFGTLQAQMKSQKTERIQLKSENDELKVQLLQQSEKIRLLEKEISKLNSFGPPIEPTDACSKKVDKVKSPSRAFSLLPTSCEGLRNEGHFANGVYLVLNEETNKMDVVFCEFPGANQVLQVPVGTLEVNRTKTSVHFYVQKSSGFSSPNPGATVPIYFDVERLNQGNAFDLPKSIFTAPVPGIYHFKCSAVKDNKDSNNAGYNLWLSIYLQVNGVTVGYAYVNQYPSTNLAVSLSASFRLAAGNTVNLARYSGALSDNSDHRTHFTGWLVEEDFM